MSKKVRFVQQTEEVFDLNDFNKVLSLYEFNEILDNINEQDYIYSKSVLSRVDSKSDDGINSAIYKINKPGFENIFLSISYKDDSYGNTSLYKIQFVRSKERIVLDYEPI